MTSSALLKEVRKRPGETFVFRRSLIGSHIGAEMAKRHPEFEFTEHTKKGVVTLCCRYLKEK